MLAKFSWLIPKGNKKGKENFCVAHTCSIERASEIRKFSCRSRVKRAKKCTKNVHFSSLYSSQNQTAIKHYSNEYVNESMRSACRP